MATGRLGFVKRAVTEAVSGALNFGAVVKVALRQTIVGNLLAALQRPAFRVDLSPATLLVDQKPALAVAMAPLTSLSDQRPAFRTNAGIATLIAAEQRPAFDAGVFADSTLLIAERPALNLTQIQIDLSHQSFVVTMTNDTGNVQNWTNPANAQGANDAVNASWGNPLNILASGKMHGTTVAQPNRPASLIIDAVYLAVWGSWSGFPVVDVITSQGTVGYRIGGITALDVQTHLHTGGTGSWTANEVRIDNGAGAFTDTLGTAVTWANIALLQFYASGTCIVGVNPTYNIDALRLRVVAHETMLT